MGQPLVERAYLSFKMLFEQTGPDEQDPQPLTEFVDEYGPVTVKEVQQVYGLDEGETLEQLRSTKRILPAEYSTATFWNT